MLSFVVVLKHCTDCLICVGFFGALFWGNGGPPVFSIAGWTFSVPRPLALFRLSMYMPVQVMSMNRINCCLIQLEERFLCKSIIWLHVLTLSVASKWWEVRWKIVFNEYQIFHYVFRLYDLGVMVIILAKSCHTRWFNSGNPGYVILYDWVQKMCNWFISEIA